MNFHLINMTLIFHFPLSRDAELVDLMYRYARENLALVNVYIKDPAVTQVRII